MPRNLLVFASQIIGIVLTNFYIAFCMKKTHRAIHEHYKPCKDDEPKCITETSAKNVNHNFCQIPQIKKHQSRKVNRALVLQGGGALGAYEVGALKFLSEFLQKEDEKNGDVDRPLFDIVAGSSMGAVNAAILVHNVILPKTTNQNSHKSWNHAIEKLHDFYMEISDPGIYHPLWWINKTYLENKSFEQFWTMSSLFKKLFLIANSTCDKLFLNTQRSTFLENNWTGTDKHDLLFPFIQYANFLKQEKYGTSATSEAARRYYYYLNSVLFGIPKVLSPAIIQPDLSYYDPFWSTHIYTRFSNEPLIKTMKKFWNYEKFPIKTKCNQPRLLLVAVDVEDSTMPVIIDSYAKGKEKNSLYSEYGNSIQYRLEYQNGVTADHVRASISTPLRNEYPSFKVCNKKTGQHEIRHFWDGAFISNSPILELIKAHTDYWQNQGLPKPPDLELYVVNLFPTVKKGIPNEPYSIQDRETDMKFQNRIAVENVMHETNFRSTSEEIIDNLIDFSHKNNFDISSIMPDRTVKSKFSNLLNDRKKRSTPTITKIVTIERQEDVENSVFGKIFDFSRKTIAKLIEDGYDDAKNSIMK